MSSRLASTPAIAAPRRALRIATLLLGAASSACAQSPSAGELLQQAKPVDKLGELAALDAEFVDSNGKPSTLADCLNGKPLVLQMVYYGCPMLCKLSRDGLLHTAQAIEPAVGDDYSIITVSFDPRDKPDVSARAKVQTLQDYGRPGAEDGWQFLTGRQEAIDALCQSVGFNYAWDPASREYAHAAGIYVLTPAGNVSRFLGGVDYSPRDLRLALTEASEGAIATAFDRFLLLCYHYDPETSRYGFAVMNAIRLLGGATVAALALGIGGMLLREYRQNHGNDERSRGNEQLGNEGREG